MILQQPRTQLPDTPFPYTALVLSVALHPLHPGDDVRPGLGVPVTDVQVTARIGIHGQQVEPVWTVVVSAIQPVRLPALAPARLIGSRSEEHTSELQSLMRISYAVFCLKKKNSHDKDTY